MRLENHIAYRFLTDDKLWFEMLESQEPTLLEEFEKTKDVRDSVISLYNCLNNKNDKPYLVTQSVLEHLDLLKVNKKDDHFNWQVFNHLPNQKVTFIFPGNRFLRMIVNGDTLWLCHTTFTLDKGNKNDGHMYWIMFFVKRETGELCQHFQHADVKSIEEYVYKFLCFFYLAENEEQIIPAGKVYGTKKTGKVSNDFKFPLTVVTSNWNVTSIRTEGFGVRGHFRVQPCGKGRTNYEIIFIEPFTKKGYVRRSGKQIETETI